MNNVIWTKVKFCRNLKNTWFTNRITKQQQKDVLQICLNACNECGMKGEELSKLSEDVINNLIDANKLEEDFVKNISFKGYASNDNANVQINGDNHIEIISIDENLSNSYSNAKKIDKALCNKLTFAYSDKYGFLTPNIKNIGSGMEISVLVLLPALSKINAVKSLPKYMDKLRFDIKFVNDGVYLISTGANLGYSEKQICDLTKMYIDKIIQCEIDACKNMAQDVDAVADLNLRAQAIINNAIKLTPYELSDLIGNILIAINSGIEKNINENQIKNLFNYIKIKDEKILAKSIKNILNNEK